MKKFILSVMAAAAMLCGCSFDDTDIQDKLKDLDTRVAALEKLVNNNATVIAKLVEASENNITIKSVTPKVGGFDITFSDNVTYSITNGTNGSDGVTPVISVIEQNGKLYWAVNNEILTDASGKPVAVNQENIPQFKNEDGAWYISLNGGDWQLITAPASDPAMTLEETETAYVFTLPGGQTISIAKMAAFAIEVEATEVALEAGATVEIAYTIVGADETTHVKIEAEGYEAVLDAANSKVAVTAPAAPEEGYLIITAIRNSDCANASLWITLVKAEGPVEPATAERYVTPTGAGEKNGLDLANAYGVEEFKAALAKAVDGREFYFAAGTYVFGNDTEKYLAVYYDEATGVKFIGDNSGATIFSGDKKYPILVLGKNANFDFSNITFKDALATQGDDVTNVRGALSVNGEASVSLNACKFIDNIEAGSAAGIGSGQEGGSAIFANAGIIYANKCDFFGNKSGSRGGAIRNETGNTLFLNECVFEGNGITREAYGRSMFTKGNTCLNKCVFHNEFATAAPSKNDPTLNTNNNTVIVNCTIVGESSFSGTGLLRSETKTSGGYTSMIMNNTFVNTYVNADAEKIGVILMSQVGMTSGGYNLLVAQNKIINASNITLTDTDELLAALPDGASWTWDASRYEYAWTGLTHTFASAEAVKTAVKALAPSAGRMTYATDFANWIDAVGASF